jgi:hypothetical protein
MQITLTRRLHALAPGLTARSALEKFAAVQMIDAHLPTTDGREIRMGLCLAVGKPLDRATCYRSGRLQANCKSVADPAWYARATHVSRSEISQGLFPGLFWDLGPFPSALIPLRSKQSWITEYFGIQKPLVIGVFAPSCWRPQQDSNLQPTE